MKVKLAVMTYLEPSCMAGDLITFNHDEAIKTPVGEVYKSGTSAFLKLADREIHLEGTPESIKELAANLHEIDKEALELEKRKAELSAKRVKLTELAA